MRLLAAVPAVDTSGDRLRLTVEATDHAAVASVPVTIELAGHPADLVLEVLAASHRVRLAGPDGATAIETVSCGEHGEPLDGRHRWTANGVQLELTARMDRRSAADIRRLAASLTGSLGPRTDAVLVAFPGDDAAVTAVEATASGWRTWHLYPHPDDPHVVTTATAVTWIPTTATAASLRTRSLTKP